MCVYHYTRRTDDSELNSRCSEAPSRVRGNTNIDGRVTYHCICDCKASRVGACCRYGVTICGTENSYSALYLALFNFLFVN